ncbi:glycosyltransferase family 8 protein [Micromonospora sp. NPDC051300]|uniref:glycosyltransferase family 8 protein n=1 Tax=Micromonospora sp. NPDC051300 TaxID=3364286 RepID=UPI0037952210
MHIGLGFDEAYVPHARVLIESILRESALAAPRFWLITDREPGRAVRDAVRRQVGDRGEAHFLPVEQVAHLPLSTRDSARHISQGMYLRLFMPWLVPAELDRLLYLDCDMLCTGPLTGLAEVELGDAVIGAVRDAYTRRLADGGALPGLREEAGLDPQAPYFNSGMLLIDLARWREAGVTRDALAYIERHADAARYPDQDALNSVLFGLWRRLPHRWNHMMGWRLEPVYGGDPAQASLVHCVGPKKFWTAEFPDFSEFGRRYWKYRAEVGA